MQALTLRQRSLVGLTLFAMFFGAGNLIFPPWLGVQAGTESLSAARMSLPVSLLDPHLCNFLLHYDEQSRFVNRH